VTPDPFSALSGAEIPDDPRLMQAVQEYLAELEAGRRPNRQELLKRFPELQAPLVQCLDGLDFVHKAAAPANRPERTPSNAVRMTSNGAAMPGDVVPANPLGDFQIIREIGRGGMGIIYEAVQLSLGRRVALKVLPFAATLNARHLKRFENEARAAAQLHHTNIVPVYYVGCERGVHFYAMQLIDGQSLAVLIEEIRSQGAGVRDQESEVGGQKSEVGQEPAGNAVTASPLSLTLSTNRSSKPRDFYRTAAKLMVQAAEALDYAHQFGIVHRDIKPANLLVDLHGRLWVADFGLAAFHDDVGLTQTGDLVGTLRYMSPEQALGQRTQLDHRTDIYSLGATLYELMALKPIFGGDSRQELLRQISHDEPRPARALEKSIPIELETIVLKAVAKHPADRYTSAHEFAADLQRYLDDQPIHAKRPTLVERARKWSRRHPSLVAAAVLLLLVCIAGLLVNNWMIGQEQAKTQTALAAERQRGVEARRALDLLVEVAEQELAQRPDLQGLRRRLLETALNYYQDFIETHGGDAGAQAALAAGKQRVRSILDELATLEGAHLLHLAIQPDVQQDLLVGEEQKKQLVILRDRSWEQFLAGLREEAPLATDSRRQKLYELAKTQEAGMSEILQPHQIKRLRQIELQLQGPRAFHDSYAVDSVKLTAEQRRRIRDIKEETMAALFAKPFGKVRFEQSGPKKGPDGKGLSPIAAGDFSKPKNFEEIHRREMEQILALLTPEQFKHWQALIGLPFQGNLRPPFMGAFGGPPPQPPREPRKED
jgi:serine/threonine protein kinase